MINFKYKKGETSNINKYTQYLSLDLKKGNKGEGERIGVAKDTFCHNKYKTEMRKSQPIKTKPAYLRILQNCK